MATIDSASTPTSEGQSSKAWNLCTMPWWNKGSTDGNPSAQHPHPKQQSLAAIAKASLLARRRLRFDPDGKLFFMYEPGKQVSSAVRIKNVSRSYVAFKVKYAYEPLDKFVNLLGMVVWFTGYSVPCRRCIPIESIVGTHKMLWPGCQNTDFTKGAAHLIIGIALNHPKSLDCHGFLYGKFQTNAPKSCFMRPPNGILAPKESILATAIVQLHIKINIPLLCLLTRSCHAVMKFVEQPEHPQEKKTRDKFKIVSLKVKEGVEYTPELFEEHKELLAVERVLQVVFLDPHRPSQEREKLEKRLAEAEAINQARKKPQDENTPKPAAPAEGVLDEWVCKALSVDIRREGRNIWPGNKGKSWILFEQTFLLAAMELEVQGQREKHTFAELHSSILLDYYICQSSQSIAFLILLIFLQQNIFLYLLNSSLDHTCDQSFLYSEYFKDRQSPGHFLALCPIS
eukprot:Gb_18107 [translate_table: standard]